MSDTMDKGIQTEIIEALEEIKTSHDELKETNADLDDRLAVAETENADLQEKVATLEKAESVEHKIKPLHWDYDAKNKFGKWYLKQLRNPNIIVKGTGDQTEETSTEGGELVPDEYLPEIFRIVGETSFFLSQARVLPMQRLTLKVPYAGTTAASIALTAEGSAATESQVTFAEATLTADRLDAFSTVSNELIEDADTDVIDYLVELFTEAMAEKVDNYCFQGTGSPVSGLNAGVNASGYSVVFDSGSMSLSDLKAKYLSEMISKVKGSVLGGAVFVAHPSAMHYIRTIVDNDDRPVYQFPNDRGPGHIYGYPVHVNSQVDSTTEGASECFGIHFGNFKKGFIVGLRKRLEVESSRHLLIRNNQTVIVYRMRAAFHPILPKAFVRLVAPAS